MLAASAHHANTFGAVEDIDAPTTGFHSASFVSGTDSGLDRGQGASDQQYNSLRRAAVVIIATCIGIVVAISASRKRGRQPTTVASASDHVDSRTTHEMPSDGAHPSVLRCAGHALATSQVALLPNVHLPGCCQARSTALLEASKQFP
jgi:hypothetical protein